MTFQNTLTLVRLLAETSAFLHTANVLISARLVEADLATQQPPNPTKNPTSLQKEYVLAVSAELAQLSKRAGNFKAQLEKIETSAQLDRGRNDALEALARLAHELEALSAVDTEPQGDTEPNQA